MYPGIGSRLEMKDEFDLDTQAFLLALDQSKPKESEPFSEWKKKITKLGAMITGVEHPQIQDKWAKITIIEMFFDYAGEPSPNLPEAKAAVMEKVSLLWSLKNIDFVGSSKTFDNLVKIIKKTSGTVAEKLLKLINPDACIVCKGEFDDPVALPCGHVGCKLCICEVMDVDRDGRLSKCNITGKCRDFPPDFMLVSTKDTVKDLKSHKEFRKGLNVFFLNLLQKLVFKVRCLMPVICQLSQFSSLFICS